MQNKIKSSFAHIHAEESLKRKTRNYVHEKLACQKKYRALRYSVIAAVCLFVIICAGGVMSFMLPTAAISMDINPSLEFKVNMYDLVIDVVGYNDESNILVENLKIKYMNYADAIIAVMEDDMTASYIQDAEFPEITVVSGSDEINDKIAGCISEKTKIPAQNIYCLADNGVVDQAHSEGISFGKYRAFLELKKLVPDITVEDVKNLSMREIRDMVESFSDGGNSSESQHGEGNGHAYGR